MAAAALGIGAITSLAGAAMQANAASKAAKAQIDAGQQALQLKDRKTALAALQQLVTQLGPERGLAIWKSFTTPDVRDQVLGRAARAPGFNDEQKTKLADIDKQIADIRNTPAARMGVGTARDRLNQRLTELQAERADLLKAAGGDPGIAAMVTEDQIKALGPGLVGQYEDLAANAEKTGTSNLSRYDATTADLSRQAQDIERYAANYGQQERSRINRDSERSLKEANRASSAALMSRGLGASSALTDAYRGNADYNTRAREDALGNLSDRQIALGTGLKTGTLGVASSRAAGRDALALGGQDTARQMRLGSLNYQSGVLSSQSQNPWLDANTTQYFPGVSPSASALGTFGSGLTGAGSTLAGYGLQSYLGNLNRGSTTTGYASTSGNRYGQSQMDEMLRQYGAN